MRLGLAVLAVGAIGNGALQAQQVVSAHAGVVHYVEGHVFVDNQLVQQKFAQFPDLREGGELRTEDGRAEVLLTPGAFLRVSNNSSVRMLGRELSDTRFEVLSGSVMVECDNVPKDVSLTVISHGHNIHLEKQGLYRLDSDPPEFRVYDGRAVIDSGPNQLTLKRGKEASLDGAGTVLTAGTFNPKLGDSFYEWNTTRSGYIASANVSAAQSLRTSGSHWSSGWAWDPWYGAYTFVPAAGIGYSPFGWNFWSPAWVIYAPAVYYGGYYAPGVVAGNTSSKPGTATGGTATGNTAGGISRTANPPAGVRPGGWTNTRGGIGALSGGGGMPAASASRGSGGGGGAARSGASGASGARTH
jgi:hypothetical protein